MNSSLVGRYGAFVFITPPLPGVPGRPPYDVVRDENGNGVSSMTRTAPAFLSVVYLPVTDCPSRKISWI